MKNTIYFPSFEPLSENWLKFALLYMEKFSPIIPKSGDKDLSNNFSDVVKHTDLIKKYKPQYSQGQRASINAIEFFDKVKGAKHRYSILLNKPNLDRYFKLKEFHTFYIYREKFSMDFEEYCEKNRYSTYAHGGIMVCEELAFAYMSYLAEEIAFEEGVSIITDSNKFNDFLNYRKLTPKSNSKKNEFAQGVINLLLPANLSEIPISKIIEFRNKHRGLINSYNIELDNSLDSIQNGVTENDFVKRYNNIYSELTKEVIATGISITAVPLGIYMLMNNTTTTSEEYIKEIIGGIGMLLSGGFAASGRWKDISNKHNCRRYLTNLTRIS
ncbi:MAG: hypothetical protein M0D57_00670 [Sphingobacteriales bacterium JAD_PAG50586_3]|nr:MAG: hypothetical protein M0D57_00670 [Sphingobacteriales bacterium JAD_PAG50586_3]